MIKKAKYPVYITTLLNPYFIKSLRILYMLKINFGHSWQILNQFEGPHDFVLHLLCLLNKELFEVIFVKNDCSKFLFTIHNAKIINVAL